MRARLGALLFFLISSGPGSAIAQSTEPPPEEPDPASAARDAEGRGLFEAGRAAFADGRYEDALDYFDRAYALTHRPELLYNIGSANDRLRRDAAALVAFEEYVRVLPTAANVREVEARMRVLRESLAAASPATPPPPSEGIDASETRPADDTVATDAQAVERDQAAHEARTAPPEAPAPDEGPGVVGEWWLWTLVGGVAAGAIVLGVVLGTQGSGGTSYPPYLTGDNGVVVLTLTAPLP